MSDFASRFIANAKRNRSQQRAQRRNSEAFLHGSRRPSINADKGSGDGVSLMALRVANATR